MWALRQITVCSVGSGTLGDKGTQIARQRQAGGAQGVMFPSNRSINFLLGDSFKEIE